MIGASKILTVSYGTFSCTLEGFDDPFNTMKAIAEYFRDLAAEDRYFGAEPPTPDAAMLHKIAEREIQRRVEAKIQENGVILRAGEIEVQAMPAPIKPASESPMVSQGVATEPATRPAPAPAPEAASEARLSRMRDAVTHARQEAAIAPAAARSEVAAVAKPIIASPVPVESAPLSAALVDYVEDEVAPADIIPEPDVGLHAPRDVVAPVQAFDQGIEDEDFAEADFTQGDFSARDALDAEDFTEEFTAESAEESDLEDTDDVLNGLLETIAAETAAPEVQPTLAEVPVIEADLDDTGEEDDLAGMLAGIDFGADESDLAEPASDLIEAQPETEAGYDDEEAAFGLDLAEADDLVLEDDLGLEDDDAEPEADLEIDLSTLNGHALSTDLPAESPEEEADQDDPAQEDAFAGIAAALTAAPEPEAPAPRPARPVNERLERARGRVIVIRRTPPVDASLAESEEIAPPAPIADATSALSAEAEADLMRELAEVRAEAALAPTTDTGAPQRVRPVRPVRPARASSGPVTPPPVTALGAETGEDSVSRLLAETNSQMDGPESRRRLAAIQHLKAAVAATVAERRAGLAKPTNSEERQDPYRADLSQIVHGDGEGAANRPSPLVLVSEQRIDRRPAPIAAAPAPAAIAPAQPQAVQAPATTIAPLRVGSAAGAAAARVIEQDDDEDLDDEEDVNIFEDNQGFADFADRLGAQGLPDLLEAAAAYASCVEGRPHFSRPQIMRQIANTGSGADSSREDGLRSFGRLLRDGTIVKVRRGHYALTERSHYLVEARKLVG